MSDINWIEVRKKLPYKRTPEEKLKRQELWKLFDINNNGLMSLAELDKGMRDVLNCEIIFSRKPVMMRAWQAAKDAAPSRRKQGDDYVEKREFRILLQYLRQYLEFYQAFDVIDFDDDRRISWSEFKMAIPVLEKWTGPIKNPDQVFHEMDTDKKGKVLFDEFCTWSYKHNLDLEDDDNDDGEH